MSTRSIRNEIARIRESLPDLAVDYRPIVIIEPATWPLAAHEAYLAAFEHRDRKAMYDIIEQQTGQRPSDRTDQVTVIEIVLDRDLVEAEVVG